MIRSHSPGKTVHLVSYPKLFVKAIAYNPSVISDSEIETTPSRHPVTNTFTLLEVRWKKL